MLHQDLEGVHNGALSFIMDRRGNHEEWLFVTRPFATRETLDSFLLHLDLVQQLRLSPSSEEWRWLSQIGDWLDPELGLLVERDPVFVSGHPKVREMSGVYLSFEASGVCLDYGLSMPRLSHWRAIASTRSVAEVLDAMPWIESPWGAGGWVDSLAAMARGQLQLERDSSTEKSIRIMQDFLRERQNRQTGLWGSHSQQGLLAQLNGAYHAVRCLLVPPYGSLPNSELIARSILGCADTDEYFSGPNIHGCNELDIAKLMSWVYPRVNSRIQRSLAELGRGLLERLLRHQNADGGFGFFGSHCAEVHNYLAVATSTPGVSDIQGTVFSLEAIRSLATVVDRAAPTPWDPSCTHG